MSLKAEKNRAAKIFSIFKKEYPDPRSALDFKNSFELLIATILSAQCTDARVNIVTKSLFSKYHTPKDYVEASSEDLEKEIYSTGFFKQKTKSIKNCCSALIELHNGEVPADFESLARLPGVGRKTASVVAGNAFGIPAIAVDTHVIRISNLLGFVDNKDPEKIEKVLKEIIPQEDWVNTTHYLIAHGRKVCIARRPKCFDCSIGQLCPSFNKQQV